MQSTIPTIVVDLASMFSWLGGGQNTYPAALDSAMADIVALKAEVAALKVEVAALKEAAGAGASSVLGAAPIQQDLAKSPLTLSSSNAVKSAAVMAKLDTNHQGSISRKVHRQSLLVQDWVGRVVGWDEVGCGGVG